MKFIPCYNWNAQCSNFNVNRSYLLYFPWERRLVVCTWSRGCFTHIIGSEFQVNGQTSTPVTKYPPTMDYNISYKVFEITNDEYLRHVVLENI